MRCGNQHWQVISIIKVYYKWICTPFLENIAQVMAVVFSCMWERIFQPRSWHLKIPKMIWKLFLLKSSHIKWNGLSAIFKTHIKARYPNTWNIWVSLLDNYLPFYDNNIPLGYFNAEISEDVLMDFCDICNLKNLVKDPTCFKNVENPSCIALISTNRPKSFQKLLWRKLDYQTFTKWLLRFLKSYFKKRRPKIVRLQSFF